MKARTIVVRGMIAAALAGGSLVAFAPAAAAQNCVSTVPGYARHDVGGVAVFVEDARCGRDPNRRPPSTPPKPNPNPNKPDGSEGCRPYPDGELCGQGISNSGRPPLSTDTWIRLYGSPRPPQGTVRVGNPTPVGGGGRTGTVTVGPISNPDKDSDSKETSEE